MESVTQKIRQRREASRVCNVQQRAQQARAHAYRYNVLGEMQLHRVYDAFVPRVHNRTPKRTPIRAL